MPSTAPQLYAGVILRRSLAYLVDVLVIAILGICLGFALSIAGALTFGLLSPIAVIILSLWPIAYHSYFLASRGATPGMRLFDLELRDWSGKNVAPLQAVLATILFYVTVALTAWLILLVVLFTDRSRALHDILAGTLVVRRHP
ncbi:RDD family protein [Pelagibius sp. CAU 1746]|uniref:RDD family protein n=1 Tax=Pelagibius sp. CAU 1746 TaxID=3140370 RepID=UPI00325ADC43